MLIKKVIEYVESYLSRGLRKLHINPKRAIEFKCRLLEEYNTIPVIISSEPYEESTRPIADFKDLKLPFESMYKIFCQKRKVRRMILTSLSIVVKLLSKYLQL